ncbi:MAG: hypothetical protein ACRC45_02840 [Cetobacterium sp.]
MANKNMSQWFMNKMKTMKEDDENDFNMTLRPYQQEAMETIMKDDEYRPFYLCWSRRLGKKLAHPILNGESLEPLL